MQNVRPMLTMELEEEEPPLRRVLIHVLFRDRCGTAVYKRAATRMPK